MVLVAVEVNSYGLHRMNNRGTVSMLAVIV